MLAPYSDFWSGKHMLDCPCCLLMDGDGWKRETEKKRGIGSHVVKREVGRIVYEERD